MGPGDEHEAVRRGPTTQDEPGKSQAPKTKSSPPPGGRHRLPRVPGTSRGRVLPRASDRPSRQARAPHPHFLPGPESGRKPARSLGVVVTAGGWGWGVSESRMFSLAAQGSLTGPGKPPAEGEAPGRLQESCKVLCKFKGRRGFQSSWQLLRARLATADGSTARHAVVSVRSAAHHPCLPNTRSERSLWTGHHPPRPLRVLVVPYSSHDHHRRRWACGLAGFCFF